MPILPIVTYTFFSKSSYKVDCLCSLFSRTEERSDDAPIDFSWFSLSLSGKKVEANVVVAGVACLVSARLLRFFEPRALAIDGMGATRSVLSYLPWVSGIVMAESKRTGGSWLSLSFRVRDTPVGFGRVIS